MDEKRKIALLKICGELHKIAGQLARLDHDDQDLGATIRNIIGSIVNTEVSEMYFKVRGKT